MQNREKSKVLKDSCIYSTITHLFILWESSYMFLQLENSEVSLQAHFFVLLISLKVSCSIPLETKVRVNQKFVGIH